MFYCQRRRSDCNLCVSAHASSAAANHTPFSKRNVLSIGGLSILLTLRGEIVCGNHVLHESFWSSVRANRMNCVSVIAATFKQIHKHHSRSARSLVPKRFRCTRAFFDTSRITFVKLMARPIHYPFRCDNTLECMLALVCRWQHRQQFTFMLRCIWFAERQ